MYTNLLLAAAIMASLPSVDVHTAQTVASTAAAQSLLDALDDANLDAIATIDPTEPGAFVAALHIKGGQLLVVRARHSSVDAVAARLNARQFRDVYIDLQATPATQGKLFVMDAGADGLPGDIDQPDHVDVIYENGTQQTMFNGARAQKLSGDVYRKQLAEADVKYTRLLNVLTAAIAAASPQRQIAPVR